MDISMIPRTVVGSKYDIFAANTEPQMKKLLCSALRYMCHLNGCDLVFTSVNDQTSAKYFKNTLARHTFRSFALAEVMAANEQDSENPPEDLQRAQAFLRPPDPYRNHENPLSIYAGTDSF